MDKPSEPRRNATTHREPSTIHKHRPHTDLRPPFTPGHRLPGTQLIFPTVQGFIDHTPHHEALPTVTSWPHLELLYQRRNHRNSNCSLLQVKFAICFQKPHFCQQKLANPWFSAISPFPPQMSVVEPMICSPQFMPISATKKKQTMHLNIRNLKLSSDFMPRTTCTFSSTYASLSELPFTSHVFLIVVLRRFSPSRLIHGSCIRPLLVLSSPRFHAITSRCQLLSALSCHANSALPRFHAWKPVQLRQLPDIQYLFQKFQLVLTS